MEIQFLCFGRTQLCPQVVNAVEDANRGIMLHTFLAQYLPLIEDTAQKAHYKDPNAASVF
jgi:hypothetical protein